MCIDYRGLNAITVKNVEPLPHIDDLLDRVHECRYFTKIDLKSGCHQIAIGPEDRHKTAFQTRYGLYEFVVMPFSLCNAPCTFQHAMNKIFHEYLDKFIVVYLDDILIFSRTVEEHAEHLKIVLGLLRQHQYKVNLEKCEFGRTKILYLGREISADGLRPDDAKVASIRDWPRPQTVIEVRSFLGMTGYYRPFVKNYSTIASPLADLTRLHTPWEWTEECEAAFRKLKYALTHYERLELHHNRYLSRQRDSSYLGTPKPLKPPPTFSGDKKNEALDTWLRTVSVWVRVKRTLVEEEVITAASYLEDSAARWLNGLVASKGFGRNMGDWAQTHTLESFMDLVEARWHNPRQAQIATDGLLKLDARKYKSVRELTTTVERLIVVPGVEYNPQVLLTMFLRCLPTDIKNLLANEARLEYHAQLQMISGNHPEANAQAEHMNRVVQHLLRHYIKPNQDDWDEKLPLIASQYNNAVHNTTGVSPNQLHLGWKPRSAVDFLLPENRTAATPRTIELGVQYEKLLQQTVEHIKKSQEAMIASENKRHRQSTFQVGERVWVNASELGQEFGISRKLMPQYFGPWEVLDTVGNDLDGPSYVICIPGHLRTYPVFHASKLAPFVETTQLPARRSMLPPTMDGHVDDVLDHIDMPVPKPRGKGRTPKPAREYRVHFRHHTDPKEDRWISREELVKTAPQIVADYEKKLKGKAPA
ncbi:hypothetical protein CBR_g18817 [Chara braunii]|uniref:Reverse transcriptase domain-containing protein n=1 Tax=Chara braunii TaxID=69332 RepID=A0A388KWG5_CHABU|nr:hypothetical protein CBR_g18817 [Chara braunii]|eukprot:GBG74406.1 hypothetical protein CBR_g18817 [Chara braunii]